MDSFFHFIFVLIFLIAARVHVKHHSLAPLFFALVTLTPDIDHFFGLQARATFHNIFITLLIPLSLVLVAFWFEKKGVFWKQFSLILLVALAVHPVLDLPTTNHAFEVQYFWPFSHQGISIDSTSFPEIFHFGGENYIVSPLSASMGIAFLIMLPILFLEETIGFMDRRKESLKTAAKDYSKEIAKLSREP